MSNYLLLMFSFKRQRARIENERRKVLDTEQIIRIIPNGQQVSGSRQGRMFRNRPSE